MCDVDTEAVASCVDAPSIYDIPKVLHRRGPGRLRHPPARPAVPRRRLADWDELLRRVHNPEHDVEIALVGKYIDLPDAYLSVTEAMRAGGFHHDAKVRIRWVASDECETEAGAQKALGGVDAVLVPGRLRRPRHRGQARRAAVGPRARRAHARDLPRACSAW